MTRPRTSPKAPLLRPDRVRSLASVRFGWIDCELHQGGWLRALSAQAVAAYAFLCLAADRRGVSFYRRDRIGRELGLDDGEVHLALARLEQLDLVAYRPFRPGAPDGFRQVLSLPRGGPPPLLPPSLTRALSSRGA